MSQFRKVAVLQPQSVRIGHPFREYRAEAALNGPVTDRRASFTRRIRDGSVGPSNLGRACKHTAKLEPAAWSWAQMTSGFGAQIEF
jgi:hypothetical protein